MKANRYSQDFMRAAFEEVRGGASVREVCRKHGISPPTFYRWKKKIEGDLQHAPAAAGAARGDEGARRRGEGSGGDALEELKRENAKLQQMIVDLMLGKQWS